MTSDRAPVRDARSALGFDPNVVLAREPGVLLDRHFLGALHAELLSELGAEAAAQALLQIGFLHGLQDAELAVTSGGGIAAPCADQAPLTAPLAVQLSVHPCARPAGAIELRGCWPERHEALARLARLGPAHHASCFLSAGYTSGWLSGVLDTDILAVETECRAAGAATCRFVARDAEVWATEDEPRAHAALAALDFDALRRVLRRERAVLTGASNLDRDAAAVHIWGPVMVIPFSGADEALSALDLVGRDPAASHVSVVVVDLSGAVVDEAFGAVALEQIVETVDSWGAESIFAEVSPLSEAVVSGLTRQPLLIHKDLSQAIAAAFQIAESQRRLV